MAAKVSVYESEYEGLKNQLQDVHSTILEQAELVLGKLEALNSSEGEFYTESITPKVEMVCSELKSILSVLSEVYSEHEAVVVSFQNAVGDLDTCC